MSDFKETAVAHVSKEAYASLRDDSGYAEYIAERLSSELTERKEDENGYTEFQLWCFIELYGEYMGITMPNVIEPLEIVYER